MKISLLTFAFFILSSFGAKACGICGALMPGYIVASDKNHWISTGCRYDGFGVFPGFSGSSIQMQHLDLQAKVMIKNKVEVIAMLPYQIVSARSEKYVLKQYSGWCDFTLIGRRVFVKRDKNRAMRLAVGGGVELPAGNRKGEKYEPLMQPGSGSLDWIAGGTFGVRNRNLGLNSQLQLKWNGVSQDREHRANSIDFAAEGFGEKQLGKGIFIQPKCGIFGQFSGRSSVSGEVDSALSNQCYMGTSAGVNLGNKKWFINISMRKSIWNNAQNRDNNYNFGCNISLYYIL